MDDAEGMISTLGLEPIPLEGGWFRRVAEGPATAEGRATWSAILALFTREQFSAVHRLAVDEIWFFHSGDPVEMLLLHQDGRVEEALLGGTAAGSPSGWQRVVRAGTWQGARPIGSQGWSLVSCICVPGFAVEDFELGVRAQLMTLYPDARAAIGALTR